ncbi:hypothetical protein [Streptomyces cinnamoneus]|uniref:hypothetical protein n=1 Tax=Streptomyces cinnamoneus TaxID=53446 RepID=UPI001EFE02C6|nr:hypothetical protein [Streptomyces cinnamoneus]
MKFVTAMIESAVKEKRIAENPAVGVKIARTSSIAVDEDEIPTLEEVDLLAHHIAQQYRLTIYLMSGAGLRPSEALAFASGVPADRVHQGSLAGQREGKRRRLPHHLRAAEASRRGRVPRHSDRPLPGGGDRRSR